jgi:hypothetical protein
MWSPPLWCKNLFLFSPTHLYFSLSIFPVGRTALWHNADNYKQSNTSVSICLCLTTFTILVVIITTTAGASAIILNYYSFSGFFTYAVLHIVCVFSCFHMATDAPPLFFFCFCEFLATHLLYILKLKSCILAYNPLFYIHPNKFNFRLGW